MLPPDRPAPRSPNPSDSGALADLVACCIDRWEDEGPAALEALAAAHPEQAASLRERIERLLAVGLLGDTGAEVPRPERLGEFRILATLGHGGMGVVYLAEQAGLGRRVTLKLLRSELLHVPDARSRFQREVEAVARLQHAGIVPVFAAGAEQGVPYYAMEYVHGATLEEAVAELAGTPPESLEGGDLRRAVETVVRRREVDLARQAGLATPLDAAPADSRTDSSRSGRRALFERDWTSACLHIAQQVAGALQHAHERGVLHRDVKPSNVMLTLGGRTLLLDFGLAAAEGSERLTGTGRQLGSLAWMSPEQLRGEPLDARTDVYSLGATLYELLTLRSPFVGCGVDETRRRILEGRYLPVRELDAAVTRDAETVCGKAMDLDRERRYADADAFASDLQNALALRPVLARRPGAWLKARRWSQRRPAAATALLLGVAVVVGGPVGYGVVQGRAAERERELNDSLVATNAELDTALGDLRATHDELARANATLERTNADLQRSLSEEQRLRAHADRSFERSQQAVEQMLRTVGASDLWDVPGLQPVRRMLLERATAFYDELSDEAPDDPDVARDRAANECAFAMLLSELGEVEAAQRHFAASIADLQALLPAASGDRALRLHLATALGGEALLAQATGHAEAARQGLGSARELLEELVADPGADPAIAARLGAVLTQIGLLEREAGEGSGREEFERAAALLEPWCASHPDDLELAVDHAGALSKAGTAANTDGDGQAAEDLQRRAWRAYESLLARGPADRHVRSGAVETANNFGLLLLTRADRQESERVLRRGAEVSRALATDFPDNTKFAKQHGLMIVNLAAELGLQERYDEMEPLVREAIGIFELLAVAAPGSAEPDYLLGVASTMLAGVLVKRGEHARAGEPARRGVELLRRAYAATGRHPAYRAQLASAMAQLADVERLAGDPIRAIRTAEEGLALDVSRPDVVVQEAGLLARLAGSVAGSEAFEPETRSLLEERLLTRALDRLARAVAAGFDDGDRLWADEDFAALRGRAGFAELIGARP